MSEKLKNTPKTKPIQKKAPEKKDVLKMQKDCKVETRKELTKINLDNLKDQVWYKVKPWENIWRIIYNHAKESWKKPIKVEKLKDINITPWDKIYFSNDEVIIKYLWWGTKKIPFERWQETKCIEKQNKENIKAKENNQMISIEDEIKLWEINEKNLEKLLKKEEEEAKKIKKVETKEQSQIIQTIFDKDSPLLWDKIAYKNETEIRKKYWKKITQLVDKYCKWRMIDESFLYWVIARESRFDNNAKSHTWVKWLGQITNDTLKTLINIHEAKLKNNPEMSELYITDELKKSGKKDKKWNYPLNYDEALKPLNQIKLTLSYLMYLEEMFIEVKNNDFKTELIIMSYNLGPWKTQEILEKHKWLKNWDWLKTALQKETNNWKISLSKLKEVKDYVPSVKENISKAKDIKIASL